MSNPLSDHDTELFEKFKKLIPDDSTTIDFMFKEYFGSTYEGRPLKPLHTLKEVWITAAYEFEHPELNKAWLKLKDANRQFLKKLVLSAIPKCKSTNSYYFGERDEDNEERIEACAQEVNNLARTWCQAYNHFMQAKHAVASGRKVPEPDTTPFDPNDVLQHNHETEIMSLIHPLHKDVHEDWLGHFCNDEYLPLIKLAMPKYRGDYHVIAWNKVRRSRGAESTVYDVILYVVEGNNSKARTYSTSDALYKVQLAYTAFPGSDFFILKIFKKNLEGRHIASNIDDGKLQLIATEEEVIVRSVTISERNKLLQMWPDYFDEELPLHASTNRPKPDICHLTRPCRILTGDEATLRWANILQNQQNWTACGEFFYCTLARWEGTRHGCVGIQTRCYRIHHEKRYRFTLLLTSFPAVFFNRVALVLSVRVPDHNVETYGVCEGEIARPSLFNGKDVLEDSKGNKWPVLDWHVRDDLEKEETAFFDEFFRPIEQNSALVSSDQKQELSVPPSEGLHSDTKLCRICGWVHTTDCSRWEHPHTHEVVTTSKKRAKLLFDLHSGMEKDGGDTAINNFISDGDRKSGYQAGDILGDKLQTLLYFSTKRGRGRIRKPDEKAPQGRPSKKKN